MTDLILLAAVLSPAAAAVVWAALAAWRWPRRVAGSVMALSAHAAAWAVFWLAYRGEPPAWRSLEATLLGASVLVATELAVLVASLRAEGLGRRGALGTVTALGVATSAVGFASFSTSLVVQALFVPAVTIAAALGGLSGAGRRDVAGVLGLAGADVACLAGLAVWATRLGSVVVAPTGSLDLGGALVLAGAAIKAGAVPGVGTWRLAATGGPGTPVAAALRGQGIALAVLAGMVVSGSDGSAVLASLAAGAALAGGIAAAASTRPESILAAVAGVAACVPFVSLGLGGAVGARAFLLSFPPFLLASGAAFAAGRVGPETADEASPEEGAKRRTVRLRRWLGFPAALAAVVSLAALPGGGGHPGTALALDLAGIRAQTDVLYLGLAGALALGLAIAAAAAVPVVAAARPHIPVGIATLLSGAALVYMGSQPVRLGIGWWLRIEDALGVPGLLPSAGAPSFPPARGIDLVVTLAPAAGLAMLIAFLGRWGTDPPAEAAPIQPPRPERAPVPATTPGPDVVREWEEPVPAAPAAASLPEQAQRGEAEPSPWRAAAGWSSRLRARAHRMALGLAAAALLEAGAVALSVFLVTEGVRLGFL